MPDRYGRATCTAEPRLRSDILTRIEKGRGPARAYEVPGRNKTSLSSETKYEAGPSSGDSASVITTARNLLPEVDISDLHN